MKILIAGSGGMVGRNIIDAKPWHINLLTPSMLELNYMDYYAVNNFLKINKPDFIINAAGVVGGIQANINNPVRFLRENTIISHNLIWGAHEAGIKNFINLGSSCMYPKDGLNPLKENMILTGELEPTNEGYAIAKIFSLKFCEYLNRMNENINFKTFIPCNLFGLYDKFDDVWGHLIPSVIRKLHHCKEKNEKIVTIWGDGNARREFMYAKDFADFIWYSINNFEKIPEVLNVGTGLDYSIKEYYLIISKIIGYKGIFNYDFEKPIGMNQKLVDNSQMMNIGWKNRYTLEKGIEETYSYYINNVLK